MLTFLGHNTPESTARRCAIARGARVAPWADAVWRPMAAGLLAPAGPTRLLIPTDAENWPVAMISATILFAIAWARITKASGVVTPAQLFQPKPSVLLVFGQSLCVHWTPRWTR